MTQRDQQTKGQQQLSPTVDDRDSNLERESVLARACELLIGLLIGSNIFSRGEF